VLRFGCLNRRHGLSFGVAVAWSQLAFLSLYLTLRPRHRELSIANRAEFLGMRRRSTYAVSGKMGGRLAFLSYWGTISAAGERPAHGSHKPCLVPLNPESPTPELVRWCRIH